MIGTIDMCDTLHLPTGQYDVLADKNAVEVLGNNELTFMAQELVREVRKSVTVDWIIHPTSKPRLRGQ